MSLSHCTVLVIEDNQLNMELITAMLEPLGCVVIPAESAEEGIALAEADPPNLILLDIRLPGMSGNEAVGVIRAHPDLRRIPVIAVTAQAMQGDEEQAIQLGFDAYVSKPINSQRLRELVRSYLGGRTDT
ncbi:MAG TPA: response regulator [Gemmatimonadales bacterium]|jgi:two-component system cell cycle response regulator DivK